MSITFSSDQQKVIDLVQSQINFIASPSSNTPNVSPIKRCIVQGKAGKTLIINNSFHNIVIITVLN